MFSIEYTIEAPEGYYYMGKSKEGVPVQLNCSYDIPFQDSDPSYLFLMSNGCEVQSFTVSNRVMRQTIFVKESLLQLGRPYRFVWYSKHRLNRSSFKLAESGILLPIAYPKPQAPTPPPPAPAAQKAIPQAKFLFEITSAARKVFADVFAEIDKDKNGEISYFELKAYLTSLGFKFPDEVIKKMMVEADVDKSGGLTFTEFFRAIKLAEQKQATSGWATMKQR